MNRDPVQQNIEGVKQLIGSKSNKILSGAVEQEEGVSGEHKDVFTLELDDTELIALKKKWELKYAGYEAKVRERQEKNKTYYLGTQNQGTANRSENPIAANILFEAQETFLPAALAKNPEPVVWADNTAEGTEIAEQVKTMLQHHADTLVLRRKLMLMTRHWSIYFIGVLKHGWDPVVNDIYLDNIDPQSLILDPNAGIGPYGDYDGNYVGERKRCSAEHLIELFPDKKEYILLTVDGKLGTEVTYTEWWSDEYCFYTYKDIVLDKSKNPHFNYEEETEDTDEDGQIVKSKITKRNHFAIPKKPYTFLSVFTLGQQPHDITNLIEQNIPNQNLVNKRTVQIDTNLDRSNNSIAFSQNNFNEEQARQASMAMQKGNPILVPGDNINQAVVRFPAPSFPDSAFKQLETSKNDLRSIFGTEGISSQPPREQTTARGMILNQQFDNTRIGGSIGDALEQVADNIFNWWVQMYYVYYDQPHVASIVGGTKAVEYVQLISTNLDRRLVVSVTPNSMRPKDEISQANQAMQLWDKGALDPKTLLTMLNFPDPQTTAENVVLWLMDKNAYLQMNFPDLHQKIVALNQQMMMDQGQQGPTPTPGELPPPQMGEGPTPTSMDPASAGLSAVQLPPIN